MNKKLLSVLLTGAMLVGCLPGFVNADDETPSDPPSEEQGTEISYIVRSWDAASSSIQETTATYIYHESDPEFSGAVSEGTYFISLDTTVEDRVCLAANSVVNLIIADGVTLKCNNGIYVPETTTLNIYGQQDDSGRLEARGWGGNGAIGGNDTYECSGFINIHGCNIDARTYSGAGIGGGGATDSESICIYGGTVYAEGSNGAGIGSGMEGKCRSVNIYGGTITAIGNDGGSGIGPGNAGEVTGPIMIYGGDITAIGYSAIGTSWVGEPGEAESFDVGIYGGNLKLYTNRNDGWYIGSHVAVNLTLGNVCVYDENNSIVPRDDRVSVCTTRRDTQVTSEFITITECSHSLFYSSDLITDTEHTANCSYCSYSLTEPHCYERGVCTRCGHNAGELTPPAFIGHALQLSGRIGLQYFFTLPEDAVPETASVTFTGRHMELTSQTDIQTSVKAGYTTYMVQLNVSSIQMAEGFAPTLHYTDINGQEHDLPGASYSVMDYINYRYTQWISDPERALLESMVRYGFHAQQYLSMQNGWTYGVDYTPMYPSWGVDMDVDQEAAKAAVAGASMDQTSFSEYFSEYSVSIRYADSISLRVIFTPKPSTQLDPTGFVVSINGSPSFTYYGSTLDDGRYAVTIEGLSVLDMNRLIRVECTGSLASVEFYANSYIRLLLNANTSNEAKNAVTALYEYSQACRNYANTQSAG